MNINLNPTTFGCSRSQQNPGIDVAKHGKRLIHEAEVGVKFT